MWEQNENWYALDDLGEEEPHNMKSFFARRRKWVKISQLVCDIFEVLESNVGSKISCDPCVSLTQPYTATSTGIYLNLDKKGFIKRKAKLEVSQGLFHWCGYIIHSCQQVSNAIGYIFTNHGRAVRIKTKKDKSKHSSPKIKKKLIKGMTKKALIIEKEDEKEREDVYTDRIHTSKKKPKSASEEDYFSYEEIISDDEFGELEKTPRCPLPKRMPKTFRYLYSDSYVEKKHSKKRQISLKYLIEDQVVETKRKPMFHHQTQKINSSYSIGNNKSTEEEEGEICSCAWPTLGDFFPSETNIIFSFQRSHVDSPTLHLITNDDRDISDSAKNITVNIKSKQSEIADLSILSINSSETVHFKGKNHLDFSNTDGENHSDDSDNTKRQYSQTNLSVILLSRTATRPDILRKDFKSNYKEALCKPRRFIINISHLAYQHFVLNGSQPFHMLPHLDLSLYLVFSFVKEADNDVDAYRIKINTTLQLSDTESFLASLCQGEIKSIHEIMHQAINALDSLDQNQVKKKRKEKLNDGILNCQAVHSFNALTNACKWKIQILDHLPSLEWLEDLDGMGPLSSLLEPGSRGQFDEMFEGKAIQNDAVLSRKVKGSNSCKIGSDKPYLCGVCLQDFNENESAFPLALGFCRHWFCEACWKSSFQFHSNKIEHYTYLRCLEQGCTSPIDPVSLLSLLHVQVVRDYQSWKWYSAIENTPQLKLCPNLSCQRICFAKNLQQPENENINITCSCLYEMCFSCMSSPHWPLSCSVANIYRRRLDVLNHDNFQRQLVFEELPNMILKGISCPKCATITPANCQFPGLKTCSCGCVFCWPCGEEVNEHAHHLHGYCTKNFQIEDRQLKQRLNEQDRYQMKNGCMTKWYRVALLHRQHQHPQVVRLLYKMANHVAEAIGQVSNKGKYIGNVRQAAAGWNNRFRKMAKKRVTHLQAPGEANDGVLGPEAKPSNKITGIVNDLEDSPRSISTVSSYESLHLDRQISSASQSQCDPMLKKAILNIVDSKIELHHIIEHVAILLEYSHTLHQPGKVFRCLERAEDLSVCLEMLLQPSKVDRSCRIVPSFLRIRSQIASLLSTLVSHLRQNDLYHNNKRH